MLSKKLVFVSLMAASMALSGCSLVKKNEPEVPIEGENAAYTVMIYMCGSNLESGNDGYSTDVNNAGYATEDISEILSISGQPKDVNVIIETGGALAWKSTYGIPSNKLGRWHVENKKLVKDEFLNNANMGASSTFQSFLEWGLSKYPADKTGVILWNHGGATRGVCNDETSAGNNDALLASEVNTALTNAFKRVGRKEKLEWIGYDACLMQVQDIAEKNSEFFNYMIGSEESEAGEGWAYDHWIDDLYAKKETPAILTEICDSFVEVYEQKWGSHYDNDQTLSFLDLSKMPAYKTAWENFATAVKSNISNASSFQTTAKKAKTYGTDVYTKQEMQEMGIYYDYADYGIEHIGNYYYDYGYLYFGTFDAYDFLSKVKNDFSSVSSQATAAMNAFKQLVVHNAKGDEAGESNGLCCYFPCHSRCEKSKYYSSSETNFTNWRTVVNTLGA